jgi:transposase
LTKYTPESLAPLLQEIRSSNLALESKTMVRQMATDIVSLADKVTDLQAQIGKLKEQQSNKAVNQPSGKKAEFEKGEKSTGPKPKAKRKKKLGGKRKGAGNRSKKDLVADERTRNELKNCPDCHTDLSEQPVLDTNTRVIEDTPPPPEKSVVTEETSDRKWCPSCKKIVSAKSGLALNGSDIGLNATILMVYLWVVAALSLPNIKTYLAGFMRLDISTSGIIKLIIRVADILTPVADEILEDVRGGTNIWADETGWRVRGVTWWLWAFANETAAYYYAAPCRGSPVILQILGDAFWGVLITDGWAAYNLLPCLLRQTCMAHIFRKIRQQIKDNPSMRSILRFYIELKRLLRDGERLREKRKDLGEVAFLERFDRLQTRLDDLLKWKNPNAVLTKVIAQVQRQQTRILSFVLMPGCPSHNNYAEYTIRKGVLKRKVSGGSMSKRGANAYAILMSIAQTCHLRKISFWKFLAASLRQYMKTSKPMLLSEYAARLPLKEKAA